MEKSFEYEFDRNDENGIQYFGKAIKDENDPKISIYCEAYKENIIKDDDDEDDYEEEREYLDYCYAASFYIDPEEPDEPEEPEEPDYDEDDEDQYEIDCEEYKKALEKYPLQIKEINFFIDSFIDETLDLFPLFNEPRINLDKKIIELYNSNENYYSNFELTIC